MFQWIRLKVRNAVLAGMNDAVEMMQHQGADDNDTAESLLSERLQITHNRGVQRYPDSNKEDGIEKKPARARKSAE